MDAKRNDPLGWLAKVYGRASADAFDKGDEVKKIEEKRRPVNRTIRHCDERWLTTVYRQFKG
ncbi:hypothetical protein LPW11_13605 [Geomonas sp. RF6]|uniref:hypothetical protein n=1 Tax=Geomonas sp. RF6 TaxID=2897342 RepID=UPI001E632CD6|nr:hypothetical protein [Geomonas sp. RF6]UFS68930.1 hypothetical protein LPW11_13605 [Geomonas sp. RF6]